MMFGLNGYLSNKKEYDVIKNNLDDANGIIILQEIIQQIAPCMYIVLCIHRACFVILTET